METGLLQQASAIRWSDNSLNEYLLVVNVTDDVRKKIIEESKLISGANTASAGSYITIAAFHARESMEDTIIRYVQRICGRQPGFEVALNNYGGIPPHTIYLRVQDHQPFRHLARELKVVDSYITSCACPSVNIASSPHLCIVQKLPEQAFFEALSVYARKCFHETFMVNELVLLRRVSQYEHYKSATIFRLQPPSDNLYN